MRESQDKWARKQTSKEEEQRTKKEHIRGNRARLDPESNGGTYM
jgi:hypothetical protein